ncbi:MAG TPA: hypothetical protein VNZ52_01315 [Candidatus Thermoplasmatota archaeon]|nr:hypothetical protein [Candidatus Thermoplasmatota archaeon]
MKAVFLTLMIITSTIALTAPTATASGCVEINDIVCWDTFTPDGTCVEQRAVGDTRTCTSKVIDGAMETLECLTEEWIFVGGSTVIIGRPEAPCSPMSGEVFAYAECQEGHQIRVLGARTMCNPLLG